MRAPLRIAVTGLHRGENPQPGFPIIQSLRAAGLAARITGLVYDVMESGIYAAGGADEIHLMPYHAAGREIFLARLGEISERSPFDILIPTLDSELDLLVGQEARLANLGIKALMPEPDSFRSRSKWNLPRLASECGVATPKTHALNDVAGVCEAAEELGFPLFVKGPFYDAKLVDSSATLAVDRG